ncbi:right-handed parallel beta-helix repeat-containing protein [Fibrisoma montanum]|uniref:Right-handed parallel beta-helix repeat-containing protein n=1 Tax=Fibrisoma montanum TaxID=2305895 RepID=A0A418MDS5_9BACT|nr:right-handed parallel beta-helix repeat-containing protein [Fibrisoma montanum]RIV24944.1 right-handed parallel beta-helix repeat-containing protein [Fibrisoma montanum]
MKKLLIFAALSTVLVTGCKEETSTTDPTPQPVVQEAVSGEVSGVWKKGSTYKITGHLQVPAGKTLTIEEGVTVLMNDSTVKPEIVVRGNLYSLGTTQNPVKITVPDAWKIAKNEFGALWGGIVAAPTCAEFVMQNTVLEYGGAVTTETSPSVKGGLYKAAAGERIPAIYYSNVNGQFVVTNSIVRNFYEDGFYLEGGKVIVANNKFYTTGIANGDAINIKSGVVADVAFNLIYSPNTNGLKLSNSGDRTPQAYVIGYNNTILNAGWRRPTTKGGSIWLEKTVRADLYNNLLVNDRFGIKRDKGAPEDNRSKVSNNMYYAFTQEAVNQFQPSTEILAGSNDIISKTAGDNDPKFVNYPLNTAMTNATFNQAWDFNVQAGSPTLGKGTTSFTRNYANGLTINGVTYKSPEPTTTIGAFGTK